MTASYTKLRQCTGEVQQDALARAEDALNATIEMLGSENEAPDASGHQMQLGMESGLLLFCFVICFSGFRFVRMVNLCVGFWLGGCLALFFLELVAPQIAQETCYLVVPLVLTAAMLMSILCAVKRQSLYFVLGAIAAQFFGAASYNILVMAGYGRTAQGTTINEAARGCTSFFAVLGATLVYFYADVAWNAATALIGAYGTGVPPHPSLAYNCPHCQLGLRLADTTCAPTLSHTRVIAGTPTRQPLSPRRGGPCTVPRGAFSSPRHHPRPSEGAARARPPLPLALAQRSSASSSP